MIITERQILKKYFKNQTYLYRICQQELGKPLDKTVVQIPARSGSTRVKDKNISEVCGLPLLAYSIIIARQLKNVHRVIVNTDSLQYAKIAEKYGAEVPFLRPKELAGEDIGMRWANFFLIRHLIDEGYPLRNVITFYPTSPFRNIYKIQEMVDDLQQYKHVRTCFKVNIGWDNLLVDFDGNIESIKFCNHEKNLDDNFFIKTLGNFTGNNIDQTAEPMAKYHILNNPIELIDIDIIDDLNIMEQVVEKDLYDFGCDLLGK